MSVYFMNFLALFLTCINFDNSEGVAHKLRWQDFRFFWPPIYPPPLTFSTLWTLTKSRHFWTTYLLPLVNVVCEQALSLFLAIWYVPKKWFPTFWNESCEVQNSWEIVYCRQLQNIIFNFRSLWSVVQESPRHQNCHFLAKTDWWHILYR